MNKAGTIFGFFVALAGLIQIAGNLRMCRTTCWINDFLKMALPKNYEFLAEGLPTIAVGITIIIYSFGKRKKYKKTYPESLNSKTKK